jgi:hypothetical protein
MCMFCATNIVLFTVALYYVLNARIVFYYVYRFSYVEPSLHPWNEINMIMMYDIFYVLLDLVYKYSIENFCSLRTLICIFLFLCVLTLFLVLGLGSTSFVE